VEVYASKLDSSPDFPIRQLVGFKRFSLKPGETTPVEIVISPSQLSQVNDNGKKYIEPGKYLLSVGGRQPHTGENGSTNNKDISFVVFTIED
jgi:beta-glucosidase